MTNEQRDRGMVLLIGGTGSIGREVVRRLDEQGHRARVLTRDVGRAQRSLPPTVEAVQGDLTNVASLRAALEATSSVVMTHGAPYGSGSYEAIDYGAVPMLLEALDGRGVRVTLMTSIGVTDSGSSARDVLEWKRRGERLLRVSGLPYTIVRPGWFDAGTGREERIDLRQGDATAYGPVRREHVAETLVRATTIDAAIGKTLEVFSADGPTVKDWPAVFGQLASDEPGALDGARDRRGPSRDAEPVCVRRDLERWQR